jgi:hypothetical protein
VHRSIYERSISFGFLSQPGLTHTPTGKTGLLKKSTCHRVRTTAITGVNKKMECTKHSIYCSPSK